MHLARQFAGRYAVHTLSGAEQGSRDGLRLFAHGGTDLTSASFKKKTLEIHIDTPNGNYLVTGKLKNKQLSGTWSLESTEKGTWEGKKAAAQNP